ncbi:hypothetical protein JB92DRAFT_2940383 [Gautieria morchelliformis]|nr:hypothetical protein JB92DRAFT_2940383 [Gautieria morchelliformis]
MLLQPLDATLFALRLFGFVSLSALVITVILADQVHRHALFVNFMCTYLLYTTVMVFNDVVFWALTQKQDRLGVVLVVNAMVDSMRLIGLTATFNLVLHLWFQMKTVFHNENIRTAKLRTFALLVTPYFIGIVPVCELIYLNPAQYNRLLRGISYLELALVILMSIWDVLLLVRFCRYRRIFRRADMGGVMSVSVLTRLNIFCLFRLIFTITVAVDIALTDRDPNSHATLIAEDATSVGESLFPLLAFLLLGLQRDVLQVWFPYFKFNARQDSSVESNWALDTKPIVGQNAPLPDMQESP